MPFVLFNGKAGDQWTNDTGKVAYQFVAALANTCGVCLQYHMAIGNNWPIPYHRNCRCVLRPVFPGQKASPFVDFQKLLDKLPESQKEAAIGRSNYKLLKSGLAKWNDIVRYDRVRDFHEVVGAKRLDVKSMVRAGVRRGDAEHAFASVNTAQHKQSEDIRAKLVAALRAKGMSDAQARKMISSRLGSRVSIGPAGSGGDGPQAGGPKRGGGGGGGGGRPVDLGWKPPKGGAPKPKPSPKPKVEPTPKAKPKLLTPEEIKARLSLAPELERSYEQAVKQSLVEIEAAKKEQIRRFGDETSPDPHRINDGAIQDRLQKYLVGDAKIKAIVTSGEALNKESELLRIEHDRLLALLERETRLQARVARKFRGAEQSTIDAIVARREARVAVWKERVRSIESRREATAISERDHVLRFLQTDSPAPIHTIEPAAGLRDRKGYLILPPRGGIADTIETGVAWIRKLLRTGVDFKELKYVVGVAEKRGVRAHCNVRYICLDEDDTAKVVVHEFGHAMDQEVRGSHSFAFIKSNEFLSYRVGNERPQSMSTLFPRHGFEAGEYGRKDKFDQAFSEVEAYYVGKDCGFFSAEIMSMGIEKLYASPTMFAKKDPEYFKFVIGMLDGSLR